MDMTSRAAHPQGGAVGDLALPAGLGCAWQHMMGLALDDVPPAAQSPAPWRIQAPRMCLHHCSIAYEAASCAAVRHHVWGCRAPLHAGLSVGVCALVAPATLVDITMAVTLSVIAPPTSSSPTS